MPEELSIPPRIVTISKTPNTKKKITDQGKMADTRHSEVSATNHMSGRSNPEAVNVISERAPSNESAIRRGSAITSSTRRNFFQSSNMAGASEVANMDDNASIGLTGTFRAAAMARRMVNASRRNLLKQNQASSAKSFFSAVTADSGMKSERTPLKKTPIDETESLNLPYGGSDLSVGSGVARGQESKREENEWVNFLMVWIGKPISLFLLFVPFAIAAHYQHWGSQWIFWLNFLTMVPLASILGDFTEEAALHTNDVVGGLLNASFGNAVEVVVAIQALMKDEIRVVQASMIGSIFSNLLLVLGCCFLFGGFVYKEQKFSGLNAMAGMGLLALSSIAFVLPTPFGEYYEIENEDVLAISRLSASFMLFSYVLLLIFQLFTHKDSFEADTSVQDGESGGENDDEEEATIPMWMALVGLGMTTGAVTIFSDFLVESIDDFCTVSGISRTFVGLIILPIVGNAVEHITAISVAMKNKMDLALGVAIGSCTQIAMFVVPVTVLFGWFANKPMTLNFPVYEISLYILSLFTVSICLQTGKSNWLLGSVLVITYIMVGIGFWFEKVETF